MALGVLLVNDHLLKGADLLPGWCTGKLSDFAGLYLAPVLAARCLLVRSRLGFLLMHGLLAAVFTSIQLSPDAARIAETAMSLVGIPWVIYPDPWDMVALPCLPVSYWAFRRCFEGTESTIPSFSSEILHRVPNCLSD